MYKFFEKYKLPKWIQDETNLNTPIPIKETELWKISPLKLQMASLLIKTFKEEMEEVGKFTTQFKTSIVCTTTEILQKMKIMDQHLS
jgi:hypothetical protein